MRTNHIKDIIFNLRNRKKPELLANQGRRNQTEDPVLLRRLRQFSATANYVYLGLLYIEIILNYSCIQNETTHRVHIKQQSVG